MIDSHINNRKSIKFYVKNYLYRIKAELKDKVVIDIPAGNGATTEMLIDIGAKVFPFDLFPEYFKVKDIECQRANIKERIPLDDQFADMIICQEGLEHVSDQLKVLKEFNRVLTNNGRLLITTPSYSNLAAKLNYLLFESESAGKMPPNEIDDIWMSDRSITDEVYHGHIFMIGIQKMRILGKLAGLKIMEIKYVRLSKGSLLLFPFIYPFILILSFSAYLRSIKKNKRLSQGAKRKVYREQLLINITPANLINRHTFMIFRKGAEHQ